MKFLLDTTFFLPIFSIKPTDIPINCLDKILKTNNSFYYSNMIFFELTAKSSSLIVKKLLNNNCPSFNIYFKAIRSKLLDSENKVDLEEINFHDYKIWEYSCFFHQFHSDFIDCIHYSSALIKNCDYFLSEEIIFDKLITNKNVRSAFENQFPKENLIPIISYNDFMNQFGK